MTERIKNIEEKESLNRWLFNPFYYIAGGKSLLIGILSILISGFLAYKGNFHFNGIIDINFNLTTSYWLSISELIISWVLMCVLLYIAGKLISKSHFRMIDVFGTQALARVPDLFIGLAAMIPGSHRFVGAFIVSLSHGKPPAISLDMAAFMITIIIFILMTVWMVALMYRAFAVSCNVSGTKSVVSFMIALFVGEIISIIIFSQFPKP